MVAGASPWALALLTSPVCHANPEGETQDRTLHASSLEPHSWNLASNKTNKNGSVPDFFLTTCLCKDSSGLPPCVSVPSSLGSLAFGVFRAGTETGPL